MKIVKIPDSPSPYKCRVNNLTFEFPAGTLQTVPDEVAALIAENTATADKHEAEPAPAGHVCVSDGNGGINYIPAEKFVLDTLYGAFAADGFVCKDGTGVNTTTAGAVADATADTLLTTVNALLSALRDIKLIEPTPTAEN